MKCNICEFKCSVEENGVGKCRMYTCQNGEIKERIPNRFLAATPINIETMPILHFSQRGKFLQICTVGCNFRCDGCISNILVEEAVMIEESLLYMNEYQVIKKALDGECEGIVFCMNDPIVSYFTFFNIAKLAKENNLYVGFSSNLYFTEEALDKLIPFIDFVNIGLKGFTDKNYKTAGALSSSVVFRNIKKLFDNKIHFEISIAHIKGMEEEVLQSALFLKKLSADIPLQVMRFIPLADSSIKKEPDIEESEMLCDDLKKELNFVYLFNSPGSSYLNTECPQCKEAIIEREFFGPMGANIVRHKDISKCDCGYYLEAFKIKENSFVEEGFMGGYRLTRAMEMLRAILESIGVRDEREFARIWFSILNDGFIREFHHKVGTVNGYLEAIEYLGLKSKNGKKAGELCRYIKQVIDKISETTLTNKAPSVLYVMGYPNFALNKGRLENELVEKAGGFSLNRMLEREGKPGINLIPDELESMNPDFIITSGFIAAGRESSKRFLERNNIKMQSKIHTMPPCWDFGSPRFIFGIMHLANIFHPNDLYFDLEKERSYFYDKFYDLEKDYKESNRSFYTVSV